MTRRRDEYLYAREELNNSEIEKVSGSDSEYNDAGKSSLGFWHLCILTEAAWLLRTRHRSLYQLFESFDGGLFALLTLDAKDLPAVRALMKRYEDSGIQFADAALAHLAERENIRTVFTTNRRDFSIIRLKRNRTLKLLPEVQ